MLQAGEFASGEGAEMIADNGQGNFAFWAGQLIPELNRQTFGKVAGANAERVHALDQLEGRVKLFRLGLGDEGGYLGEILQGLAQIAILIERFDDQLGHFQIPGVQPQTEKLLLQMISQGSGRFSPLGPVAVIGFVAAAGALRQDLEIKALLEGFLGARDLFNGVIGALGWRVEGRWRPVEIEGLCSRLKLTMGVVVFEEGICADGLSEGLLELHGGELKELDRLL